ncbi:hypothetical protein V6N11_028592 [Hibiscus sabdariffa]|uniref:Uncharacterized protein n=2 Tax=Hibiscus sabdariffa TaxID=183260 RepID=A0ABR2AMT5_9ROSI
MSCYGLCCAIRSLLLDRDAGKILSTNLKSRSPSIEHQCYAVSLQHTTSEPPGSLATYLEMAISFVLYLATKPLNLASS